MMSDEQPTRSSLQPHQRQSAADFVMDRLCELISEDLSPGDKLPPQRELAETLNVSLPSVREALATLQAIGVIDVRHGKGMFVSEGTALGTLLRTLTSVLMRDISFEELFAVRETIELENCRTAAAIASDEEKEALQRSCEAIRGVTSAEEFVNADVEFHLEIGRMSGNRLRVLILDMVRSMIESVLMALPEQRELACKQHEAIARAIADGDPERAVAEMQAHLAINRSGLEAMESDLNGQTPVWQAAGRRVTG